MLTRTIAVELAPHGITVNNIAPGAIETPINQNLDKLPEQRQRLLSEIPLGKIGIASVCENQARAHEDQHDGQY